MERTRLNKIIRKVKTDLKIELPEFNESIDDKHFKNLLVSEQVLYERIAEILTDETDSLAEKQEKLEILTHQQKSYKLINDFSIPNSIKEIIKRLDKYISESLNSKDDERFLSHKIMQNLSKNLNGSKQNMTENRKRVLRFFILGLELFKRQNKSFGLFLCSTLIFFLRKKSKQSFDNDDKQKVNGRIYLDFVNDEFHIERVALVSVLGSQFIEFIQGSKSLVEAQLLNKAKGKINFNDLIDGTKNPVLSLLDKVTLVERELTNDESEFYKLLVLDSKLNSLIYDHEKANGQITVEIGIILLIFLEACGLIIDRGQLDKRGEDNKTYGIVQVSKEHISAIFEVPFSPSHLPMVSEPKRWLKDSSASRRNFGFGGFHFNEKQNIHGVAGHMGNKGIAHLTDEEIESINYLQCNTYNINQDYLDSFKVYGPLFFSMQIKSMNYFSSFSEAHDGVEGSRIKIRSLEEFMKQDELYESLKEKKKNKKNIRELVQRKMKLQTAYFDLVNALIEFIHLYHIACLYAPYDIFFALSIDGRGRFYYSSARGGFGLQTNRIAKSLIELNGNTYKNPKRYENPQTQNKTRYHYKASELWGKYRTDPDFYKTVKSQLKIWSSYEGIDASCSGTSIISGLIGYEKGLEFTNITCEKGQLIQKNCIYMYFLNYLAQHVGKIEDVFPKSYFTSQAKVQKTSVKEVKEVLKFILNKVNDKLLTRDHVKIFVMCQNYAQQNQGRADYIHDYFLYPELALDASEISEKVDYKFRRSISFKLAQWIERHYKICFPELDKFCKMIRTKISHTQALVLCAKGSGKFEITIPEGEIIRTTKPSFNKKNTKRYELSYFVSTNKINKSKSSRAAVANFVHFLDSRLCTKVILKCLKDDIILWTNHDCFYTAKENHEKVKRFYFESYRELLLENNTLAEFFSANQVIKPHLVNDYLRDIKIKQQNLNNKLKKGELIMNENILS